MKDVRGIDTEQRRPIPSTDVHSRVLSFKMLSKLVHMLSFQLSQSQIPRHLGRVDGEPFFRQWPWVIGVQRGDADFSDMFFPNVDSTSRRIDS